MQIYLILGVFVFFALVVYFVRQGALSVKYSLLWFFFGVAMLLIGIFPQSLRFMADRLGFEVPSNALFSLLFFFLMIILMSITSIVSRQADRIKELSQSNALLEKRLRDLEASLGD